MFVRVFWILALIASVTIQLGLVTLPDTMLSVVVSILVLFVLPGFLLAELLFGRSSISLVEKLAVSFALGIGLLIIPGTLLLMWHSSLTILVWVSTAINVLLLTLFLLLNSPKKRANRVGRGKWCEVARRVWGAVWGADQPDLEFAVLSIAVVVFVLLLLSFFSSEASMWRWSDGWSYAAYVRRYMDENLLDPHGTISTLQDGRFALSGWLVLLALIGRVSQSSLTELYWFYLAPILTCFGLLSFYALAKTLFRAVNAALFATLVQLVYLASSMFLDTHGREFAGLGFMTRAHEDKYFSVWVIMPIALVFAFKYLNSRRFPYLLGFLLSATTATIIHPMGYVSLGIALGSFVLINISVTLWVYLREKREISGGRPRGLAWIRSGRGQALLEWVRGRQAHLVSFALLFLVLGALVIIPWLARDAYVEGGSLAFAPPDPDYIIEYYSHYRHLIMSSLSWYMASPTLLMHPMIILALLLMPILALYLRRDWSAQFLLASLALPLVAIFNPITAPLLGKLISGGQIYRLRWMLPISLVIGFVLYRLVGFLQRRLLDAHRVSAGPVLHAALPLLAIMSLILPVTGLMTKGIDAIHETRNTPGSVVSPAERDVLEHLNEHVMTRSMVLADNRMERFVPAFTSKAGLIVFRRRANRDIIDEAELSDEDTATMVDDFYRSEVIDGSVIDFLARYNIEYLLAERRAPVTRLLYKAPSIFHLLYGNQDYQVYQVASDLRSNPMVSGDLFLLQNRFDDAINAYRHATAASPDSILAYLGLARAYQGLGRQEEAFANYRQVIHLSPDSETATEYLTMGIHVEPVYILGYISAGEFYKTPVRADVTYSFLDHMDEAEKISPDNSEHIRRSAFLIGGLPKGVIFQHPPSSIAYQLEIPPRSNLILDLAIAPDVWSLGGGDGVQFDIKLEDSSGSTYRVFSEYIDPKNVLAHRKWHERKVDLSLWSGQVVTLTYVTQAGPNSDTRYDWAGWGEPRIVQPVAYDFLDHLSEAEIQATECGQTEILTQTIGYEARSVLVQYPPSRVVYSLTLPPESSLRFGIGADAEAWSSDTGDGIEYNIYVRDLQQPNTLHQVFHRYMDPKSNPEDRHWLDEQIDLSHFGGQQVEIIFETKAGLSGDASCVWGGWSRPVLIDETLPDVTRPESNDSVGAP
jgi:tetratricopeptide (TPR) repeat protein